MRPSLRSVVAAATAIIAVLVVLLLLAAGAAALPPTGVRPLRPVPARTTKSVSDIEKAALALQGASADWSKALRGVTDAKPWNLTSENRAAAKKIADTSPWVEEDTLVGALVAVGTVAAVVGPGRLLWAGTRVLWAGWLWARVAGRRFRVRVLLAWWRRGLWGLLGTLVESVRWQRYGPGRTLGEWAVVSRAWLEEWAAYPRYEPERRIPRVLREWLRAWDNYLTRVSRV